MNTRRTILGIATLGLVALGASAASAQSAQVVPADKDGFVVVPPEAMKPPEGGRTINLLGDPSKPGLYVIRIIWEPGQGSHPHYHDQDRLITVLEGTWYVSTGPGADKYDPDHMTAVKPGTFIMEPAYGHHYDMAKDQRVVVQITGMGPVHTIPIKAPAQQ
jgi:quercetin dioxygenase-like cupin family protein